MKKSIILFIVACSIMWLAYFTISPLKGFVFTEENDGITPKDAISTLIAKFDKSKNFKPIPLNSINNINIIGENENVNINVNYGTTQELVIQNDEGKLSSEPRIKGKDLTIKLGSEKNKSINITLDSNANKKLSLQGLNSSIMINSQDYRVGLLNEINIGNKSKIDFSIMGSEYPKTYFMTPLNIQVTGKSKLNFSSVPILNLNIKLDNGLFNLKEGYLVDTLKADLKGLSNIIIGKYPEDKKVKSLIISGDLDYYNQKKPK